MTDIIERIDIGGLDNNDRACIRRAIRSRLSFTYSDTGIPILPDGYGTDEARALAEICRGWMEMLDMDAKIGGAG